MTRKFNIILCLLVPAFVVAQQSSDGRSPGTHTIQPFLVDVPDRFPNFIHRPAVKRPKVAVVLSGGGARGLAAIGVFKSFEKNRIPIDLIVGTSIGSIVGGLYAAGYSTQQLAHLVDSTNWDEVLSFTEDSRRSEMFLDQKHVKERSLLVLRFKGFEPIIPSSFSTGQRLTNYLNILALQSLYHPNPSFDNLKIPFRAVTTDLISGRRIIIDRGDLTEAMRASVTVPLLFSTVPMDSFDLMDGGLVSNIPVDVARQWGADIVVAVDMTSPLRPREKLSAPWEYADQIMGIMMQESNKRALEQADIVIKPSLGKRLSSDFTELDALVMNGEEASDSLIPLLQSKYSSILTAQQNSRNAEFKSGRFRATSELPDELKPYLSRTSVTEAELRSSLTVLFQKGEYESVELLVQQESESTMFDLRLTPNPVLTSVEFVGNKFIITDSLHSLFEPLIGKQINPKDCGVAIERIRAMYRSRGYSLAHVLGVDFNRLSGKATISVDEGVIYRMDIVGTKETKDYVIWRELPFDDGDIFQISKVAEGIRNLYGTGLFEQVSITSIHEGENNIVLVKARERSTDLIRLGLRIDSERNVQASIDVRDENVFGMGAELGVRLFGGSRNRSVVGEFKATRIFDSYLTLNLKGYSLLRDVHVYGFEPQPASDPLHWDRLRVGEYREIREGGSLSFGTQLERLGSVTVEGRLETHRIQSIFNQLVEDQSYKISSIKFGTSVDTQNKFPYPSDGLLFDFNYETALVKVADAVGFTKMSFEYERYFQLFPRHVVRPKFVLGVADETTPLSEQFSLGGQQNFFGLREDNARGRQLVLASIEYIYESPFKLFFDTFLKARYDIGAIWAAPEQIKIVDFLHGIGCGIAFDTPIGSAEFSVGRSFFLRKDILDNPLSLGPFIAYFSIGYHL